jgi:integrase
VNDVGTGPSAAPQHRLRDLRAIDVLQARARLLASGLAPRTVNLHVDKLRAMLTWAVDAGLIAQSPLGRIKKLPDGDAHARYRRRALSEDEIARFLAAADADDRENEQRVVGEASTFSRRTLRHRGLRIPQAPLWRAAIETGARYGELRALTWGDVDLANRVLTLRAETTKAGKSRSVPIRREFAPELARLRELHARALGRQPEAAEHVFLSAERRPLRSDTTNAMRLFDRLLERAGIDRVDALGRKLDIHGLRHTAATKLQRDGVPLAHAQRILGHSDPKLTARIYGHLEVEDLRDSIDRAAPRSPDTQLEQSA